MIFYLSLIFCFGTLIITPLVFLFNDVIWWQAILFGLLGFILMVGLFCLFIVITLPFVGRHYAKTYDPKDKKRWNYMVSIARFACFWLAIRIKVEGLEKIDSTKTLVFYSNHQCYIDPLIYHKVLHKIPHATMYKEAISKYALASGMAKALGGVAINREDDRSAIKSVIIIINEVTPHNI